VLGIGGGSVLDAAKAIAGLLPHQTRVLDHLEGVGRGIPYAGPATPFIAVPTTAGTGSEATKNAVLSLRGEGGYKKSFRHEALVARVAIVDPDLLDSCPQALMAAQGMDAFTQLLESYVSIRSNPMTEALAWSGMEAFRDGLFSALDGDPAGRARIAYGSLQSGICLAQTGLGSVHGLASPLGAFFPIPHGVVCGTLLAEATHVNIRALRERAPDTPALAKYARVGVMLSGAAPGEALDALVDTLRGWTRRLELARIGAYGMSEADIPRVVASCRGGSMQTNPLVLSDEELAGLLRSRL
jgi:alcohol dehydrogenase